MRILSNVHVALSGRILRRNQRMPPHCHCEDAIAGIVPQFFLNVPLEIQQVWPYRVKVVAMIVRSTWCPILGDPVSGTYVNLWWTEAGEGLHRVLEVFELDVAIFGSAGSPSKGSIYRAEDRGPKAGNRVGSETRDRSHWDNEWCLAGFRQFFLDQFGKTTRNV
jgi:hypothetical protein